MLVVGACLGALSLGGCVFPARDPTGVELSWRFTELNENDLDPESDTDLAPVRTCAGALVQEVSISIVDNDDATRNGTFDYNCEDGFQTPDEARTEASDAFLELDPGSYAVEVSTTDTMGRVEIPLTKDIDVLSRTLTIEAWDLSRPLTAWRVQLTGATACGELQFRLRYSDPKAQLGEPELNEEGDAVPTLYRQNLMSDRGLSLGGAPFPCSPDADGLHLFTDLDPGEYTLEITRDGQVCALGVLVDLDGPVLPIDLANLPCEE
jgi:hypothetical protein